MSPSCLAGLAIVVVEDHDDARRYLDLFLRQLGAEVMVASNVSEEKPFWPKVFTIYLA
jgi:CheY-like chemotaxis protein